MEELLVRRPELFIDDLPASWSREPDRLFSADELIEAYTLGRRDGKDEVASNLKEKFERRLISATSIVARFYDWMKESGEFTVHAAFLRIENIENFDTLILVSEDDYVSDDFEAVHQEVKEYLEKEGIDYGIDFSFMPYSDQINRESLNSDGFRLRYEPTAKTRPS